MPSEATFETTEAGHRLGELIGQFEEKSAQHPEMGIEVERSGGGGSVDFGWGRCELEARTNELHVRVEADEPADVERLQELLTRHLEHLVSGNPAGVRWSGGPDLAASPRDSARKDLMRSFHRRARDH